MQLERDLNIVEISSTVYSNKPYQITSFLGGNRSVDSDPSYKSVFCLGKKHLEKFGIIPDLNLKGRVLSMRLTSREFRLGEVFSDDYLKDIKGDLVTTLMEKRRTYSDFRHMGSKTFDDLLYDGFFKSYGSSEKPPICSIKIPLNEDEFIELRKLLRRTPNTVMTLDLKLK